MILLVDIDGTIADWGAAYDRALEKHGDAAKNIRRHAQQQSFDLHEGLDPSESEIVRTVMDEVGFYANLDPIPGALEALQEMVDDGHEVFLVTSPWPTNLTCESDKKAWVVRHLGIEWARRLVISSDKTIVHGDILFDDKPEIHGVRSQSRSWSHILIDQPYNQHVDTRYRLTDWALWRDLVFPVQSAGMGGPDVSGWCPVKGCATYIMGIPEDLDDVPADWHDDDIEPKIRAHNRDFHDTRLPSGSGQE